jgi:DNA-binding NarL/FixJ family response regulator
MEKTSTVRVVLADDNDVIRMGLKKILDNARDIVVVGEANNGLEVMRIINDLKPDILLLDVEMPLLNGIEVTRRLKKDESKIPILVISAHTNREYIREMLAIGVSGYLIKDEAPERIVEAVRGIAHGETGWISPQVKASLTK